VFSVNFEQNLKCTAQYDDDIIMMLITLMIKQMQNLMYWFAVGTENIGTGTVWEQK